jgi:hypothetical protein
MQYDFLLHAMLGLAASEITTTPALASNLTYSAISHRVQAIRGLNRAVSEGIDTAEKGNAMLATCYALSFQAVLIEDGLSEFMSFIRGLILVAMNMGCKRLKFLFHTFMGEEQLAKMGPHLGGSPNINPALIDAACNSLEAFAPLCQQDYEKGFHASLTKTARALYTSSREGTRSSIPVQ